MKRNSAYDSHSTWSWTGPTTCTLHEDELCCNLHSARGWTRFMTRTLHEAELGLWLALYMKLNPAYIHVHFVTNGSSHKDWHMTWSVNLTRITFTWNIYDGESTWIQFVANFRIEDFTVVPIHIVVFCVVTPCLLVDGTDASKERTAHLQHRIPFIYILKVQALCSAGTFVLRSQIILCQARRPQHKFSRIRS
jgi:hypothetical protein